MKIIRVCIFLIALGCASFAAPAASKATKGRSKTAAANANRSDTAIEQDLKARFARSKIASDKFQAHVQNGVATIEGKTEIIQHKGAATRMAKSAGASSVVNKVVISEAAREKAAANLAKGKPEGAAVKKAIVATH